MDNVKISVVIPIHNVEAYVKECVESVMHQTMKAIEIICVDDASTDDSPRIIDELAKQDERVKIITYSENKSAFQARKDGVELAAGEYILFLDGDDALRPDACEKLYQTARKRQVDILHFGTEILNYGNADAKRINNLYKFLKPYGKQLKGQDIFQKCFVEKKFRFTLWNKLYSAALCKEAFSHIPDGNYPKSQDLYAFFVICYYARSYYGINEQYYLYRFGTGITGKNSITLAQFDRFCTAEWSAKAIQDFADTTRKDNIREIANAIRYDLLGDCVNNWYNYLPADKQAEGFDLLAKYWRPDEIAGKMCARFLGNHIAIADCIYGAVSMQAKPREVKTIGIFYFRYSIGGVQRVISLLIPMFLKMGYQVVFFVEEIGEEEYALPEGVQKIVLPPTLHVRKTEYIERAVALQKALEDYKIDLLVYNASSSPKLLFDTMVTKLLNIPIILTVHEVAFQGMLYINREIPNRPSVFRLMDKVIVLSKTEELYWRLVGVNAQYIPNPVANKITDRDSSEIEPHTIVWVGRLDALTKKYTDAVDVMRMVVPEVPDAKLLMVGGEVTNGAIEELEAKIKKNGLQKNVILCGGTMDVDQYYRKSSLHLMTSVSETFPMTIIESKSYGIPLVMYELPFLEIVKSGKGFISVPQGNKKLLAEALIRLLKDQEHREQLGVEAKESLAEFLKFDLEQAWRDAIQSSMERKETVNAEDEKYRVLIQSMLLHYREGSKTNRKKIKEYKKIERSKEYKLGCILLKYPKKIYYKLRKLIRVGGILL